MRAAALAERRHVDRPRARAVELAEEDPLPGSEREPAVVERNEDLRAHERRADVRGRVLLALLDVLPAPTVPDDPLQGRLEVAGDRGIRVLVDGDAGGRVRHVDEGGGRPVRFAERLLHLGRDLDELRLPLGLQADSAHASLSYETVPPAPPSQRELDAYREQADRFIAELDEEYYLHYAGLKESFELAPIYDRHADLTTADQAQSLGAAVNGGGGIRELWRFACEGYLGNLTREHAERAAMLEAELQVSVDGETIPYRMIRPAMANEADRGRREQLDRLRTDVVAARLNPIHLEAVQVEQWAVKELGSPTYVDLYRR